MNRKRKTKAELIEELEALDRRVERLEALNAAVQGLREAPDLQTLEQAFEASIRGRIRFDRVGVSLLKGERQFERLKTGEVVTAPNQIGRAGSATDWVVHNRKPLVREDLLADDRFRVSERTRATGIRSDIIVPLISRDEVIGTMSVGCNEPGVYTEADAEFLKPLAELIAMVADNAKLYRDLREAYRDLKLIYDRVSDLIFLMQVEGAGVYRYVSVNRAYQQATGFTEQRVVGKRIEEVLPAPAAEFVLGKFGEAIQKCGPIQYRARLELPDRPLSLSVTLAPIYDDTGDCAYLLGVAEDMTGREQAEQEIIRLERLHALEEMARGVAHNFNNILVGVLGYAQLIEMQGKDAQAVMYAKDIVGSALRAKELVQRLNMSVGRGSERPPQKVERLGEIIREAIEYTRPKWKDEAEAQGVAIEVRAEPGQTPPVLADETDLHHVLAHLISNAVDALPQGGEIRIVSRQAGGMVALEVIDNGVGMTEETQKRIFDPFFTTKQDVGSGLGLSMAYRTVAGWGGEIEVDSAPGAGSRFTVLLPVWGETKPEADEDDEWPDRLMVVDDEWAVRQVLEKALNDYSLKIYTDGEEAFRHFRAGRFKAALIDLGIPGIPGDELARRIRQVDPRVVTVLVTGWEIVKGDPRLAAFDFHVQKPFGVLDIQRVAARAVERWNEKGR